MTIAVTIQVADGMVFAADSTSTISDGAGGIINTYDNANKVVNLCKGRPIGIMFWGMGAIGPASMSTLAKDLRRRLSGLDPDHHDWKLDGDSWSVHQVAEQVKKFFYDEHYQTHYAGGGSSGGIAIGGYTPGKVLPERYELQIDQAGQCNGPEDEGNGADHALNWRGQTDALTRLVQGFGEDLPDALITGLGLQDAHIDGAMNVLASHLQRSPVHPAMPIQDAVDLADFLVETTKNWVRFQAGAPTVGGPTEIAAITKHEGFNWVRRKLYYSAEMNPSS